MKIDFSNGVLLLLTTFLIVTFILFLFNIIFFLLRDLYFVDIVASFFPSLKSDFCTLSRISEFFDFFFSFRYFDSFRKYAMNSPLFFYFFVSFGSTTLTPIDSYIILFLQDSFQLFLGDLFDHWLMIGRCRRRWCWCWCFFCTTHVGWKACKCK